MGDHTTIAAILGAGGAQPRVDGVLETGASAGKLLTPGPGRSVYCTSLSEDGALGLAGTRAFSLHLFPMKDDGEGSAPRTLHQGASLLSTCFVGSDYIAGSDTAHRVLLWDIASESSHPCAVYEGDGPITALVAIRDGFIGQRAGGGLLALDRARLDDPVRIDSPPPPRPFARARGTYWPEADAAVFAAEDGRPIVFSVARRTVEFLAIHEGGFGAASVYGDLLLTFGRVDGTFRGWRVGDPEHVLEGVSPRGVVAAACLEVEAGRFVFVLEDGTAAIGVLRDGRFVDVEPLPGSDYRSVAGLAPARLDELRRQHRVAEIDALKGLLDAALDGATTEDVAPCLVRLEALGADPVVQAFRAQDAAQAGDFLAELQYRRTLETRLQDGPASLDSLRRLAELAERLGCYGEAVRVWSRIACIAPGYAIAAEALTRLRTVADGLVDGGGVLVAEDPSSLPLLVRASDVVDVPFVHRCLLKPLDPVCFPSVGLVAEDVLDVYESRGRAARSTSTPPGRMEPTSLVGGVRNLSIDTGLVCPVDQALAPGLELVFALRPAAASTLVVPRVVFNGRLIVPALPGREHNAACLRACESFTESAAATAGVREIHAAGLAAFSAVANRRKADGMRRAVP